MPYITSDFRLTFAKDNFIWSNAPRPGLPLLRWPDGTLCEPVLYYFCYSAEKKRVKISSMGPESFTLRQWLVYLANNGLTLFDVDDDLMEKWRTDQGWIVASKGKGKSKLTKGDLATNLRIGRKLKHVFDFYRTLPMAMRFTWDGKRTPVYVGENVDGRRFPIGTKRQWNGVKKRDEDVWVRAEKLEPPVRFPKVATPEQVQVLYNYLRGRGFREQQKLKLAFPPEDAEMLGARDWLIARTMAAGGLRCQECSDLSVRQLAEALHASGITDEILDLDAISEDDALKRKIKQKVLSLKDADEFAFLLVRITGKGSGSGTERSAPFPPSLICDLLEFGVWGCRRRLLAKSQDGTNSDFIFLSEMTKSGLTSGSVGDIIGRGFRMCRIKKSAHDLRGFFATNTAASLWKEYFASNHYRFDQALVNKVLDNLARFMGHSQVTTTIKYYLDQPLFKHLTKVGTAEANLFHKLWNTLVMGTRKLTTKQADLALRVTQLIGDSDDDSMFLQALDYLTKDERFANKRPSRKIELVQK